MARKCRRRQWAKRLENALQVPRGTLYRALRLEMDGNRQAVVEGCCRVVQYDEDCIRLETVEGAVCIQGEALCVNCLSDGCAVVRGQIVTVGFGG